MGRAQQQHQQVWVAPPQWVAADRDPSSSQHRGHEHVSDGHVAPSHSSRRRPMLVESPSDEGSGVWSPSSAFEALTPTTGRVNSDRVNSGRMDPTRANSGTRQQGHPLKSALKHSGFAPQTNVGAQTTALPGGAALNSTYPPHSNYPVHSTYPQHSTYPPHLTYPSNAGLHEVSDYPAHAAAAVGAKGSPRQLANHEMPGSYREQTASFASSQKHCSSEYQHEALAPQSFTEEVFQAWHLSPEPMGDNPSSEWAGNPDSFQPRTVKSLDVSAGTRVNHSLPHPSAVLRSRTAPADRQPEHICSARAQTVVGNSCASADGLSQITVAAPSYPHQPAHSHAHAIPHQNSSHPPHWSTAEHMAQSNQFPNRSSTANAPIGSWATHGAPHSFTANPRNESWLSYGAPHSFNAANTDSSQVAAEYHPQMRARPQRVVSTNAATTGTGYYHSANFGTAPKGLPHRMMSTTSANASAARHYDQRPMRTISTTAASVERGVPLASAQQVPTQHKQYPAPEAGPQARATYPRQVKAYTPSELRQLSPCNSFSREAEPKSQAGTGQPGMGHEKIMGAEWARSINGLRDDCSAGQYQYGRQQRVGGRQQQELSSGESASVPNSFSGKSPRGSQSFGVGKLQAPLRGSSDTPSRLSVSVAVDDSDAGEDVPVCRTVEPMRRMSRAETFCYAPRSVSESSDTDAPVCRVHFGGGAHNLEEGGAGGKWGVAQEDGTGSVRKGEKGRRGDRRRQRKPTPTRGEEETLALVEETEQKLSAAGYNAQRLPVGVPGEGAGDGTEGAAAAGGRTLRWEGKGGLAPQTKVGSPGKQAGGRDMGTDDTAEGTGHAGQGGKPPTGLRKENVVVIEIPSLDDKWVLHAGEKEGSRQTGCNDGGGQEGGQGERGNGSGRTLPNVSYHVADSDSSEDFIWSVKPAAAPGPARPVDDLHLTTHATPKPQVIPRACMSQEFGRPVGGGRSKLGKGGPRPLGSIKESASPFQQLQHSLWESLGPPAQSPPEQPLGALEALTPRRRRVQFADLELELPPQGSRDASFGQGKHVAVDDGSKSTRKERTEGNRKPLKKVGSAKNAEGVSSTKSAKKGAKKLPVEKQASVEKESFVSRCKLLLGSFKH